MMLRQLSESNQDARFPNGSDASQAFCNAYRTQDSRWVLALIESMRRVGMASWNGELEWRVGMASWNE
jgi:hypothetical protein